MPELPDVTVYVESLEARIAGRTLEKIRIANPFFLRTFEPPITEFEERSVKGVARMGKRIVLEFEGDGFIVLHLMVAGRLRWKDQHGAKMGGRIVLAAFEFPNGTLFATEASKKKRASMHLVDGKAAVEAMDPGGLEVATSSLEEFSERLRLRNHTLKRALTNPRLFSGIGNAYSDEILNAAGLSPLALTQRLGDKDVARLREAARETLAEWTDRLRNEFSGKFPGSGEITAFRPGFAAHGKFGQPCLRCGTKIQRIRYAENETNYCPSCQTGGKILADRSLSRLLKDDWPRTVEELEEGM